MVKSIGGKWAVRCREVVRFSEGPLLEVLLYTSLYHTLPWTYCWILLHSAPLYHSSTWFYWILHTLLYFNLHCTLSYLIVHYLTLLYHTLPILLHSTMTLPVSTSMYLHSSMALPNSNLLYHTLLYDSTPFYLTLPHYNPCSHGCNWFYCILLYSTLPSLYTLPWTYCWILLHSAPLYHSSTWFYWILHTLLYFNLQLIYLILLNFMDLTLSSAPAQFSYSYCFTNHHIHYLRSLKRNNSQNTEKRDTKPSVH